MATAVTLILFPGCQKSNTPGPYNPLNGRTTAVFNPDKKYGKVTDIDGNVYRTIVIGTQTWMAENLRTTHYQNGDSIPEVMDYDRWRNMTSGAFCNYNNTTDLDTIATYGRLYNWYAVADSRNLAPKGWHVATAPDWLTLINYLGGDTIASKHLKEAGILHWDGPNDGDNNSGFTALPGGRRYKTQPYSGFELYADFWTSSSYTQSSAPFLYLTAWHDNSVYKGFNYNVNGYSVRCVKDKPD